MEKLEAAMAKARERRKAVLREAAAPSRKTAVAVPERSGPKVDWATVPTVPFVAARAKVKARECRLGHQRDGEQRGVGLGEPRLEAEAAPPVPGWEAVADRLTRFVGPTSDRG